MAKSAGENLATGYEARAEGGLKGLPARVAARLFARENDQTTAGGHRREIAAAVLALAGALAGCGGQVDTGSQSENSHPQASVQKAAAELRMLLDDNGTPEEVKARNIPDNTVLELADKPIKAPEDAEMTQSFPKAPGKDGWYSISFDQSWKENHTPFYIGLSANGEPVQYVGAQKAFKVNAAAGQGAEK